MPLKSYRRVDRQKTRQGAAIVEFAVCLPVIMILILGAWKRPAQYSFDKLSPRVHTKAYAKLSESVRPPPTPTAVPKPF